MNDGQKVICSCLCTVPLFYCFVYSVCTLSGSRTSAFRLTFAFLELPRGQPLRLSDVLFFFLLLLPLSRQYIGHPEKRETRSSLRHERQYLRCFLFPLFFLLLLLLFSLPLFLIFLASSKLFLFAQLLHFLSLQAALEMSCGRSVKDSRSSVCQCICFVPCAPYLCIRLEPGLWRAGEDLVAVLEHVDGLLCVPLRYPQLSLLLPRHIEGGSRRHTNASNSTAKHGYVVPSLSLKKKGG